MLSKENWQELTSKVVSAFPQIATGAVVCLLFWLAAAVVRRVIIRVGETRGIDRHLARFLARTAYVALIFFGLVTALDTMGIDVAALVAGLGLTGFALGFALKDVISNVLAGVLIIIYKPFVRDDRITVKSFHGKVLQIDLRYTILEHEGKQIFIPNSMLFTDAITVEKAAPASRPE